MLKVGDIVGLTAQRIREIREESGRFRDFNWERNTYLVESIIHGGHFLGVTILDCHNENLIGRRATVTASHVELKQDNKTRADCL